MGDPHSGDQVSPLPPAHRRLRHHSHPEKHLSFSTRSSSGSVSRRLLSNRGGGDGDDDGDGDVGSRTAQGWLKRSGSAPKHLVRHVNHETKDVLVLAGGGDWTYGDQDSQATVPLFSTLTRHIAHVIGYLVRSTYYYSAWKRYRPPRRR